MTEYVFSDGPLAGQTTSLARTSVGDAILVEVTGYDEHPSTGPGLTYFVEIASTLDGCGQLRFVNTDDDPDRADSAGTSS